MMCVSKLRKNQTVGDGVCFLEFNSGKILFWNVFLLVTFTKLTNDRLEEFKSPNFLDNFSFGHAYFLKVDSSSIGYFLVLLYMRLKRFKNWLKKFKNIIHTWLGKAFKGQLKLFNRIKIMPSFTTLKKNLRENSAKDLAILWKPYSRLYNQWRHMRFLSIYHSRRHFPNIGSNQEEPNHSFIQPG